MSNQRSLWPLFESLTSLKSSSKGLQSHWHVSLKSALDENATSGSGGGGDAARLQTRADGAALQPPPGTTAGRQGRQPMRQKKSSAPKQTGRTEPRLTEFQRPTVEDAGTQQIYRTTIMKPCCYSPDLRTSSPGLKSHIVFEPLIEGEKTDRFLKLRLSGSSRERGFQSSDYVAKGRCSGIRCASVHLFLCVLCVLGFQSKPSESAMSK